MFWETKWGRSAADTEAANAATVHAQHAVTLQRELARLVAVIAILELELSEDRGQCAANAPVFRVNWAKPGRRASSLHPA